MLGELVVYCEPYSIRIFSITPFDYTSLGGTFSPLMWEVRSKVTYELCPGDHVLIAMSLHPCLFTFESVLPTNFPADNETRLWSYVFLPGSLHLLLCCTMWGNVKVINRSRISAGWSCWPSARQSIVHVTSCPCLSYSVHRKSSWILQTLCDILCCLTGWTQRLFERSLQIWLFNRLKPRKHVEYRVGMP